MSDKKEVIIEGKSETVTLTEGLKDIATLLLDAGNGITIDTLAEVIKLNFEDDDFDVIAMYSHDSLFPVTATNGIPIARLDTVRIIEEAFAARFRAISGTKTATLEQFKLVDF